MGYNDSDRWMAPRLPCLYCLVYARLRLHVVMLPCPMQNMQNRMQEAEQIIHHLALEVYGSSQAALASCAQAHVSFFQLD